MIVSDHLPGLFYFDTVFAVMTINNIFLTNYLK